MGEHLQDGALAHPVECFTNVESENCKWLLPFSGKLGEVLKCVDGFAGLTLASEARLAF